MSHAETRRGYTIRILSEDDSASMVLTQSALESGSGAEKFESGVEKTIAAARQATGEVLIIDGKPVPFTKSADGYNIYYVPTQNTLLEAARKFVDTQPEKSQ